MADRLLLSIQKGQKRGTGNTVVVATTGFAVNFASNERGGGMLKRLLTELIEKKIVKKSHCEKLRPPPFKLLMFDNIYRK